MRYTSLLNRSFRHRFATRCAALIALALPCAPALADPLALEVPADIAPLSPELQSTLRDLINYDPLRAGMPKPVSPLRVKTQSAAEFDWNRADKPDGSSAVTVKKSLPTSWDAKIGADFGFGAPTPTTYQPDRPFGSKDNGTGAAWANVTVLPGVASVDARLDPTKEQGKLGTTLGRSLPIGSSYSLTLQNTFAVTETLGVVPGATAGTAGATPAQVWSTDRLVKFNILSTGTSLAAGTTSTTVDSVTRNKISAEQKLFENFNVTTSVTDVGSNRPTSKSISAGFKMKW
jgi:hypothetical protein